MINDTKTEYEIIKLLPQPFGFYRALSGSNYLHFGFWPDDLLSLNLEEAQQIASRKILEQLPPAPARILDIGCGLGATADELVKIGYEVIAIAPLEELITFAQYYYGKAVYICCGFLDDHPLLMPPQQYDVILSQESLQYFPDIDAFFSKAKALLSLQGKVILCDEVSYSSQTKQLSAVHEAKNIEKSFSSQGFYVLQHQCWGHNVTPTCRFVIDGFQKNRALLIELFGEEVNPIIDHFLLGWKQQLEWYSNENFGYEYWVLLPSEFQVHNYRSNDEEVILKTFNAVFNTQRTIEHWKWKYLDNPFGKASISNIWFNEHLVAHYAGYPVSMYRKGNECLTYQAGDTFTVPTYRNIGHGNTSLLSRVFRNCGKCYFNKAVPFIYGFNVDRIQKFGKLFLKYVVVSPVFQRIFLKKNLNNKIAWLYYLKGFSVKRATHVENWADNVFELTKKNYGWLLVRNKKYLQWRYEQHPDFKHEFFIVYHWNKPIGWIVGRLENQQWLLGDALFDQKYVEVAFRLVLNKLLETYPQIEQIDSWFSEVPQWWNKILDEVGFIKQRQFQNLDLVVRFYSDNLTSEEIAQNLYFTWGDSDLF